MNKRLFFVLVCLLAATLLTDCGPSQAELDAQATQVAVNMAATQTAEVPTFTPTATSTNTPTNTPTSTHTPLPTDTPTPTSTHTPTATSTHTPTPTPTDTPLPTVTPTATQTPTPTPLPPPTPTATPSLPRVVGNLQMNFIPYNEQASQPEPPIDLTLVIHPLAGEDEDINHHITDPDGGFVEWLPPGEYQILAVEVEAPSMASKPFSLLTGQPYFTVPPTGCVHIGRITFSHYRLPPGSYEEQGVIVTEIAQKIGRGLFWTYLTTGGLVPESATIDPPAEHERILGTENCSVQPATF